VSGYVRIHRSLIGHPAFRNDAEAMAFAWLVAKAAWKPVRVRYKERAIMLDRGSVAVSQRDMAKALDRDKAWIERLWKRLRAEAMIEVVCEAGVAVIRICNYSHYQAIRGEREAADEAPKEAEARQAQGTEQGIEEREEVSSEPNGSSPRLWACPIGVDPKHWRDLLKNRKTKRLTNSESAYEGQLREIAKLADDEWPPGRLVQHAAENGWAGIHDPRKSLNGSNHERPNNPLGSAVENILRTC